MEGPPLIQYDDATFERVCPKCGKFVKADETIFINVLGDVKPEPNATCKKHGRVTMRFIGFFEQEEAE